MENEAQIFEQAVARILYAASRKRGLVQRGMGEIAFGEAVDPIRQLRYLFDSKKPRSLKLSELYAWAKGIEMDPARVVSKALEIIENGEPLPELDLSSKPGRKPGVAKKPKERLSKRAA